MIKCSHCGAEMKARAKVCPSCGAPNEDRGGFGWGILGFLIPLLGIFLFILLKDSKPRTARSAGIGGLISAGITVAVYVAALIILRMNGGVV